MSEKKFFMLEDGKILSFNGKKRKNTHLGTFICEDKKVITSSTGRKAFLYFPSIKDIWNVMERSSQVIHYKDVSFILSSLQIRDNFRVIEVGGGSGYFTVSFLKLFGSKLEKYVIFERNEKNAELIKKNMKDLLGEEVLRRVNILVEEFNKNTEISETFNLAIVDIPYNFNVLRKIEECLEVGGDVFFYVLNINQLYNLMRDFGKMRDKFILDFLVEIHLRDWIVKENLSVIRPENFELSHTGWIVKFIKKAS